MSEHTTRGSGRCSNILSCPCPTRGSESRSIVRRALLQKRSPRGATLRIDRPGSRTSFGATIRTMRKMAPPPNAVFCDRSSCHLERGRPVTLSFRARPFLATAKLLCSEAGDGRVDLSRRSQRRSRRNPPKQESDGFSHCSQATYLCVITTPPTENKANSWPFHSTPSENPGNTWLSFPTVPEPGGRELRIENSKLRIQSAILRTGSPCGTIRVLELRR